MHFQVAPDTCQYSSTTASQLNICSNGILIPLFETLHTGRAASDFLSGQIHQLGLNVFLFQNIQDGVNQNTRVGLSSRARVGIMASRAPSMTARPAVPGIGVRAETAVMKTIEPENFGDAYDFMHNCRELWGRL